PDGYGLYSPQNGKHRAYRYDPRSWYYRQPGYYPHYVSNYWVPRAHMRYRYRYTYYGPKYRYYPAWGYPLWGYPAGDCCRGWGWCDSTSPSRHIHVLYRVISATDVVARQRSVQC